MGVGSGDGDVGVGFFRPKREAIISSSIFQKLVFESDIFPPVVTSCFFKLVIHDSHTKDSYKNRFLVLDAVPQGCYTIAHPKDIGTMCILLALQLLTNINKGKLFLDNS